MCGEEHRVFPAEDKAELHLLHQVMRPAGVRLLLVVAEEVQGPDSLVEPVSLRGHLLREQEADPQNYQPSLSSLVHLQQVLLPQAHTLLRLHPCQ